MRILGIIQLRTECVMTLLSILSQNMDKPLNGLFQWELFSYCSLKNSALYLLQLTSLPSDWLGLCKRDHCLKELVCSIHIKGSSVCGFEVVKEQKECNGMLWPVFRNHCLEHSEMDR